MNSIHLTYSGARLYIDDGTLTIVAKNQAVMAKAQEKVSFRKLSCLIDREDVPEILIFIYAYVLRLTSSLVVK